MANIGFRVLDEIERSDSAVLRGYSEAKPPTPNIADVMGRFGAMGQGIHPINGDEVYVVGSAFTVKTHPSDNLMAHKAMDLAEPGDIIVVEAGGDMAHAILGELMCLYASSRGILGFVVDGPVRDGASIRKMGYPVFAKGLTPRGPYKEGPGEIGVPISCGGAAICPGDVIVGDADGVVVIPKDSAGEVLENALAVQETEKQVIRDISSGQWAREWVDETLLRKGCDLGG